MNNDTFAIRILWQRPLVRYCGFYATTTQWQTSFVNYRSNYKVKIIVPFKKTTRAEDTVSTVCWYAAVFPTKASLLFMN